MKAMLTKIRRYAYIGLVAAVLITGCAPGPGVRPEPETKPPPPPPSGFVMKSFHRSMKEEMRNSYDRADEIIIGIFSGAHQDNRDGLQYYFSDFSVFDRDTQTWGPYQNVIMEVRPHEFKPELILRDEFKKLIDLDKTGICWDVYQGQRSIFLVEGKMNLIFLELGFDEANTKSYRNLLDAYPVTDECRARDVFNLMLQDMATKTVVRSR